MSRPLPELFLSAIDPSLARALSEGEPCVSVRLKPGVDDSVLPALPSGTVPWCDRGRYLAERPGFTLDPAFHQGLYYVQEASSMVHSHIVATLCAGSGAPVALLDACAAPGGKTTAALAALPVGSIAVANEFVPQRAAVLRENLIKWADPRCIVTRADTAQFSRFRDTFSIILADVPCSGEGMMRKDPEAVAQWTPALVRQCAARQWEIVSNLWPALKPGGALVYSTCTFNRTENEEIISRITAELGGEVEAVEVDPSWGIETTPEGCLRFRPDRLKGEGLFVAVIRKEGHHSHRAPKPPKTPRVVTTPASKWIRKDSGLTVYRTDTRVNAFPTAWFDLLTRLRERVDVIHEGIAVATVKGSDLIPAQSLALAPALVPGTFPTAEVGRDDALRYLAGESFPLGAGVPRGFVLLTYRERSLGFVKNLGNRVNNLYPQGWRIIHKPS